MKAQILFDNYKRHDKMHAGWGISVFLDGKVLFDTGENGSWLAENMKNMDIDAGKIEAVVISHDHWDHTGGLWELLNRRKGLSVYACPGFSAEFKRKVKELKGDLIESRTNIEISKDIFITGEIAGEYKGLPMPEQALVARGAGGLSVITGCAHPGILKILDSVRNDFPKEGFYAVLGGFHLMDSDKAQVEGIARRFRELGVKMAGPTHCSGDAARKIFMKVYGKDFIDIQAGRTIEV